MYSPDRTSQPCQGGPATKTMCGACLFIEVCLADTVEYETLTGESRRGIFGGLTASERIMRREVAL